MAAGVVVAETLSFGGTAERLLEVLQSLEQDYDPVWGSLLKQTIRRVFPGFNDPSFFQNKYFVRVHDGREPMRHQNIDQIFPMLFDIADGLGNLFFRDGIQTRGRFVKNYQVGFS